MRHQKDKSANYSEDSQNVLNDNVGTVDSLSNEETEHAHNKATEGIRQGRDRSET